MASVVTVKNIAATTSEKEVKDFFSFCGKVTSIEVTSEGATKSATVTFDKAGAARTALLLNHTKLGDNEINVSSTAGSDDDAAQHTHQSDRDTDEITQEEKPRARILAEYLAHGYLVADTGLKTAIALDEKHGVSQRFLATLHDLDHKYHATDRAKTADQSYGITNRANSLLSGLSSYFEKAIDTPTGKKIASFYTTGQRQVSDIHNEARRLAELKKQEAGGSSYKAAGLDKVFGPEKTSTTTTTAPATEPVAPSNAAAVESQQTPAAPAEVPGFGTATQVPKA